MAIAGTSPGAEQLTSTQASYPFPASGSWTPVSGQPTYICVGNGKATAADTCTLTGTNGWGVTWTSIGTLQTGGSTLHRVTLFRGIPSSGTAGVLTVDFAGVNQLRCGIVVATFSGVNSATNEGVVQSATGSGSLNGALAVTLAAFASSTNGTLIAGAARGGPSGFAPETGYTGYSTVGAVLGVAIGWLPTADTTPTGTLTSGINWAAIAIEINESVGATTQPPRTMHQFRLRGE